MFFFLVLVTIILLYFLCVLPNVTGKEKLKGLYAHRGLYQKDQSVPENSLAAFELACQQHLGIELDIQLSQDGTVYVYHDDHLKRLTGFDHPFIDTDAKTLSTLSVHQHPIPTFDEVLKKIDGRVPLIVELKSQGKRNKELCEKAMHLLDHYQGSYAIESFDPRILIWFKKNHPKIIRGQLVMSLGYYKNKFVGLWIATYCSNLFAKPDFMAVECHTSSKQLSFSLFRRFKGNTVGWTIQEDQTHLVKQYDAIIFEHCDLDSLQ